MLQLAEASPTSRRGGCVGGGRSRLYLWALALCEAAHQRLKIVAAAAVLLLRDEDREQVDIACQRLVRLSSASALLPAASGDSSAASTGCRRVVRSCTRVSFIVVLRLMRRSLKGDCATYEPYMPARRCLRGAWRTSSA